MQKLEMISAYLESKQVGIIYHFTKINAIKTLLNDKEMSKYGCDILTFASYNKHLSTTRDFNMADNPLGTFNPSTYNIRIAIDGDKLSNKFKVKPINGVIDNRSEIFGTDINMFRVKHKSEKEEVICPLVNVKYFPLKDYIVEIQIYNHYNTETEDVYDYIQKMLKQHNLNIPVNIVRKWKPFKIYEDNNKCYEIYMKENDEKYNC